MSSSRAKPVEILLIEDRRSDALLVEQALQEIETPYRLTVCKDGEQALTYLRRGEPYATATRPNIILLDLSLPKKDGLAVLAALKDDHSLCHIPVIILTDSQELSDIVESYRLRASSYIVKPATLEGLFEVIKAIETFWFSVVTLFEEDETTSTAIRAESPEETNGTPTPSDASNKER